MNLCRRDEVENNGKISRKLHNWKTFSKFFAFSEFNVEVVRCGELKLTEADLLLWGNCFQLGLENNIKLSEQTLCSFSIGYFLCLRLVHAFLCAPSLGFFFNIWKELKMKSYASFFSECFSKMKFPARFSD